MKRTGLSAADRTALCRLADGQLLTIRELANWQALEHRGMIMIEFGPARTPAHDSLCCYITDKGREALR